MPAAARVGDRHRCGQREPAPHKGGRIVGPGCATVLIGEEPAACVGDRARCVEGSRDVIVTGEPTVLIEGLPAARLGDATDGGHVTTGCTTVQIGPQPQALAMRRAARAGAALVEKHARVRLAGRDR